MPPATPTICPARSTTTCNLDINMLASTPLLRAATVGQVTEMTPAAGRTINRPKARSSLRLDQRYVLQHERHLDEGVALPVEQQFHRRSLVLCGPEAERVDANTIALIELVRAIMQRNGLALGVEQNEGIG